MRLKEKNLFTAKYWKEKLIWETKRCWFAAKQIRHCDSCCFCSQRKVWAFNSDIKKPGIPRTWLTEPIKSESVINLLKAEPSAFILIAIHNYWALLLKGLRPTLCHHNGWVPSFEYSCVICVVWLRAPVSSKYILLQLLCICFSILRAIAYILVYYWEMFLDCSLVRTSHSIAGTNGISPGCWQSYSSANHCTQKHLHCPPPWSSEWTSKQAEQSKANRSRTKQTRVLGDRV